MCSRVPSSSSARSPIFFRSVRFLVRILLPSCPLLNILSHVMINHNSSACRCFPVSDQKTLLIRHDVLVFTRSMTANEVTGKAPEHFKNSRVRQLNIVLLFGFRAKSFFCYQHPCYHCPSSSLGISHDPCHLSVLSFSEESPQFHSRPSAAPFSCASVCFLSRCLMPVARGRNTGSK